MAVNLDTRLPLAAVGSPLNPAGVMQNARANAIQQKLDEMRMDYESRKRRRETDTERYMGEAISAIRQGKPAQTVTDFQWNTPSQTGIPQSPYEVSAREIAPAVPGRQPTLEDMQAASIDAMFKAGDIQGAFEAMKQARAGQPSAMKSFGAETRTGEDGMEYAFNQATGRFEPTGFRSAREPVKPRIQIVRTARGIEVVDLNNLPPGTVLPPEKKPEAKRAPRTQVVTDETGTFVIDLDNPSAPAVPVTKPGGAQITKPKASQEPSIDESKNAGFYLRMRGVGKSLDDFEKTGAPTVMTSMASSLPFVGGYAQRKSMTEDQQQYYTAAMAWIRAKLRKESGAVIGDDEAKSEWATYFPMPGDTKANIEQKKQLRKLAEDEMRLSSGRAASKVEAAGADRPQRQQVNILPPASQLPGKIATDNTTGIRYRSDGTKWVRIP